MRRRLCVGCGERHHPNNFPKTSTGGVTHTCYTCIKIKDDDLRKKRVYARAWRKRNPLYYRRR